MPEPMLSLVHETRDGSGTFRDGDSYAKIYWQSRGLGASIRHLPGAPETNNR